jgi:hypothetical protein
MITILLAVTLQGLISFFKRDMSLRTKAQHAPTRVRDCFSGIRRGFLTPLNILVRETYDRIESGFERMRKLSRSRVRAHCPYIIYLAYVWVVDRFLWRLFIKLPLSELDYDLNLFIPRGRNIIHGIKFSWWKFWMDVIRVVFLPLWLFLAIPALVFAFSVMLLSWVLNWCGL